MLKRALSQQTLNACLFEASVAGNLNYAEVAIAADADVNAHSPALSTPLHKAANFGQTDVVLLFIDNGANVNVTDSRCDTPMHYAIHFGYDDIAKPLRDAAKQQQGQPPRVQP